MEFLLAVTLLVVALGIAAALLPFVAFRSRLTRPFHRHLYWKTVRIKRT
jgi:hypothetical protein